MPRLTPYLAACVLVAGTAAAAPTKDQSRCTMQLDASGARVARAAAANFAACLRDAARGKLGGTMAECIAADAKKRVAKAQARTTKAAARRCAAAPDFGPTDPDAVNAAYGALLHPATLFGADVDAAVAGASDRAAAACQAAIVSGYGKLLAAELAGYHACISAGLTYGFVDSGDDLLGCRSADPKGIVTKARVRAARRIERRCAGVDLAAVLPGECAAAPAGDLTDCVEHAAACDLCLARNQADGVDPVCHRFVDGVAAPYCGTRPATTQSVARQWDEQILDAVRHDTPRPTVHARNLFHLSVAMYDAWKAYDTGPALPYLVAETPASDDPARDREIAVSFAAYRIIAERYRRSPGAAGTQAEIDAQMAGLGLDKDFTSTTGDLPAAVGNRIAAAVLAYGLADGANEVEDYADDTGYYALNPPLIVKKTGTVMNDPNHWQPLALDFQVSQNGIPIPGKIQRYVSPNWNDVLPFALTRDEATAVYIDPGPPPQLGGPTDAEFKANFALVGELSGRLDPNDGVTIDLSPSVRGNNTLGTNDGTGHPINPVTGLPYPSNLVKRGDFGRIIAEFWADGPNSETPPGHWDVLANEVTDHPMTVKRIGGAGPVLDDLEWDVKLYLAVNGAVHDAAVVAWGLKRYYDFVRPISAIRYMAQRGQSSDPLQAAYDPEGLPLKPGVIEVITPETTAPGERHEALAGHEGEIAIYAWPGNPIDPTTTVQGARWILAANWVPYQKATFVTPAFPGYTSGHSTFSRAAAEVLVRFTGSEFFPGGYFQFVAPKEQFLSFELGPSEDVHLEWATFYDASDEAGLSRLYGGIHVPADDFNGRITGSLCGIGAWNLAMTYFTGAAP